MQNIGLKNYATNLPFSLPGGGNAYVNLYKDFKNLIFEVPLLETIGLAKFNLFLLFNRQFDTSSYLFSNGFRLNYYTKIEDTLDYINLTNADGTVDFYLRTT